MLYEVEACETCQGNGEIVVNWDLYLHGRNGKTVDDEAVAPCPDCGGSGYVEAKP